MANLTINIPVATSNSKGLTPLAPAVYEIPPGVCIAGKSTSINIPPGVCEAAGVFEEFWVHPPLMLLNGEDEYIGLINLEDVYPGQPTTVKTFKVENRLPGEVTYRIGCDVYDGSGEKAVHTSDATYFSLDGDVWSKSIDLTISKDDSNTFHMYWRPPSTTPLGTRVWMLVFELISTVYPQHDSVTAFTALSNVDEDEYDVIIPVTVPYVAGRMESDFGDIRFYEDGSWLLDSSIVDKVNGDYAEFLVRLPWVIAGLYHLIYVLGGNDSLEYEDKQLYHDGWNWFNGEMNGWVQITGSGNWQQVIEPLLSTAFGTEHYVLHCGHHGAYPTPSAEAPSTSDTPYGTWTMRIKQSHTTATDFRYYFAIDSEDNSYSIRFNNFSTPTVSLYLNEDVLASVPYDIGTSPTTITVDHDLDGVFTVSVNGTSIIVEVSDNTITTVAKYKIYLDAYASYTRSVHVDYMYFVEHPTTTAPTISEISEWADLKYSYVNIGRVNYDTQTLPGLDEKLRYGIRINGVLYD